MADISSRPGSQLERLKTQASAYDSHGNVSSSHPGDAASPVAARIKRGGADDARPLSLDMVTSVFDNMGAQYALAGDNAVRGIWENGHFVFFLVTDLDEHPYFQVYGQWEKILPSSRYREAAVFANDWNSEYAWPKAYALASERETGLHGEVTVDFGPRVTFEQLDRTVGRGIASCLAFFARAEESFPDAVAVQP